MEDTKKTDLEKQLERDYAIIDNFGGTPPAEIGPELKREVEADLPEHLKGMADGKELATGADEEEEEE